MPRATRLLIALSVAALMTAGAGAQVQPLDQQELEISFDSGVVVNDTDDRGVAYATTMHVPDVSWLRLFFQEATLGAAPAGGEPTVLRITSLIDHAVQILDAVSLQQWQSSSAYMNGNVVMIEIVADPGAVPSRLVMTSMLGGSMTVAQPETVCGPNDDRELSDDARVGRLVPVGCTGWLINDANNCFLTAGHCTGAADVMEFNVPLSSSGGSLQHPGPEDQYAVDPASMQSNGGQGVGNDWAYFGCFPNSNTGMTAAEAQGDFFVLSPTPPLVSFQTIRITGYGTTSSPVPPEWNQAQKTHAGPYVTFSSSTVQYQTDTTGGNSGSPVINVDTGEAIGIHTHGGCDSGGGQNSGTGSNNGGLQGALANPQGVCIPVPSLDFVFANGLPEFLSPGGDVIRVEIVGQNGGTPESATGMLHYDDGSGFVAVPMTVVSGNTYDAVFPVLTCGAVVRYYFSAETTDAEVVTDPFNAPTGNYDAIAALSIDLEFDNDFEIDTGWTVQNESLTDGPWERGVPAGGGDRGDPPTDADGSGQCFVTDNADDNSDVDGGPTRLLSPRIDVSALDDPQLSYTRWITNDDGDGDAMVVEISDDNGVSWTLLESQTGTVGWQTKFFRIRDFVALTVELRVRFSVADNPNDSVTEAGLDAFQVITFVCDDAVPGDIDGNGLVDFEDLLVMLTVWGDRPPPPMECPSDLDGDGDTDFQDLLLLLTFWSA